VQGQIEEIGTITVRLRNHDNTFHFVPTYSLLTRTFQNWSGMTERGVRMATLTLRLDAQSLRQLQPFLTWLQSFLAERPEVSREPFLLVRLSAADPYGLRVEVLYFLRTTAWAEVTQTESSILEAVIQKLPQYELRQYQYGV
jgi:miniconductance mechanosensitive channel